MEELLGVPDAARILGVSKVTLYRLTSGRRVPFIKITSKKLLFRPSDLEEFISSGRIPAKAGA